MDLYEFLGVERDATTEQVQSAYRRRARATHPDHGGDAEEFRSVALAAEILTDPEKRERYDRTGRVSDEPSIVEATVVQLTREAFLDENGKADPVRWMLDKIDAQRDLHKQSRASHVRLLANAERGLAKFLEANNESSNEAAKALIVGCLESAIEEIKESIADDERNIATGTEILTFLNGIRWQPEQKWRSPYDYPDLSEKFGNRGVLGCWTS